MCETHFNVDGNIILNSLKGHMVPNSSFSQEIIRINRLEYSFVCCARLFNRKSWTPRPTIFQYLPSKESINSADEKIGRDFHIKELI